MSSNGALIVGHYLAGAEHAAQYASYANQNQSAASTVAGVASVTVSHAGDIAQATGYGKVGFGLGIAGGALAVFQVGGNLYDNEWDVNKLTTGDILSILGVVTSLFPSLQPVGFVLSGLRTVYSFSEGKQGERSFTVGNVKDYRSNFFKDSDSCKNSNNSNKYHIYDPIVLDLDGDGIETISTNCFNGILFYHDNDGIKTATGWVKLDDGILVIDRSGNGIVDDGSELFGDLLLPMVTKRPMVMQL